MQDSGPWNFSAIASFGTISFYVFSSPRFSSVNGKEDGSVTVPCTGNERSKEMNTDETPLVYLPFFLDVSRENQMCARMEVFIAENFAVDIDL